LLAALGDIKKSRNPIYMMELAAAPHQDHIKMIVHQKPGSKAGTIGDEAEPPGKRQNQDGLTKMSLSHWNEDE